MVVRFWQDQGGPLSNKTILFADDSATMRLIVEKTFAAEPYSVISVPSGEGAIAKAKDIRPDIIIVDAGMPGCSGYDVSKAVRKDSVLSTTPVIIMSGVSNLYDDAKGKDAGITEHMKKPFDTGLLIEMVQNLIAARAEEHEDPLEYMESEEELESVSDLPMPEPNLDRLSEPPISSQSPVMRYQSDTMSRLDSPVDLKPVGKQTQDYVRPSSPPPPSVTVHVSGPPVEEEAFGEEADFGEEPLDLNQPVEPSDVPPLEFDSHDTEDHSGSFHVGTLAELAQMDARGVPLEAEHHEDAIEIESPASSLASLGPRIAPKEEELPEMEYEDSVETVSDIPDMPETHRTLEPVSKPAELGIKSPPLSPPTTTSLRTAPSTDAVRARFEEAAGEVAARVEGITSAQAAAIQTLTREIIERVVWEVVPDLAEVIIKEELSKLLKE
jgi:CheY-like chemotaxis protein